ncbi:MAG TPA: hypothetical protein VGG73_02255 [Vicinamibacterales bacterium]
MVDQNGTEIGTATDPFGGMIVRRAGDDAVALFGSTGGLDDEITFYHTTTNCTDPRQFYVDGGSGLAYLGAAHGGALFYTRTIIPGPQVPVVAVERFEKGQDATQPGVCTLEDHGSGSLGVVTMVIDSALANLALPLRLK